MKTLILGAGDLGLGIARRLMDFGEPVTLVEKSGEIAEEVAALGIDVVHGDVFQPETLKKAELEDAAHLVAALSLDEQNLLVCRWMESPSSRAKNKIARLKSDIFCTANVSDAFLEEKFGVNGVIRPLEVAAGAIANAAQITGALAAMQLDDVAIVGIRCPARAEVLHTPFRYLSRIIDETIAVLIVTRDGKTFRPQMDDVLLEKDEVYLAVHKSSPENALKTFGHDQTLKQRLLLVGGSRLLPPLIRSIGGISCLECHLLEELPEQAEQASLNFPALTAVSGNCLDYSLLEEVAAAMDVAVVAARQEENTVLISLFLEKIGVERVMTLTRDHRYDALLANSRCSIINPGSMAVESVVNRVLPQANISIFELKNSGFCVVAAEVKESSPQIGQSFSSFCLEKAVFPIFICRNGALASISDSMKAGDKTLLLAEKKIIYGLGSVSEII
ncbi:MAG: NAD-binding protein [Holosporaceae bacterium]|jgi:Trk K+ transport system NAD-binding subunit|nr:NAD-binding protein [Holosporaceae bacterium]